jgi:hypothetical protein
MANATCAWYALTQDPNRGRGFRPGYWTQPRGLLLLPQGSSRRQRRARSSAMLRSWRSGPTNRMTRPRLLCCWASWATRRPPIKQPSTRKPTPRIPARRFWSPPKTVRSWARLAPLSCRAWTLNGSRAGSRILSSSPLHAAGASGARSSARSKFGRARREQFGSTSRPETGAPTHTRFTSVWDSATTRVPSCADSPDARRLLHSPVRGTAACASTQQARRAGVGGAARGAGSCSAPGSQPSWIG